VLKRRLLRSSLLLLPAALLPWLQLGRGGEVATADSSRVFSRWGAPPTATPTKMELLCTPLERALHLRVAFRVGLPPPLSPPARHFLVEHRQPYLFPTRWAAVGARAGPIPGPRMQMTKGMRVRVVTDPVARGRTALRELALGVRAELGKDAVGRAPLSGLARLTLCFRRGPAPGVGEWPSLLCQGYRHVGVGPLAGVVTALAALPACLTLQRLGVRMSEAPPDGDCAAALPHRSALRILSGACDVALLVGSHPVTLRRQWRGALHGFFHPFFRPFCFRAHPDGLRLTRDGLHVSRLPWPGPQGPSYLPLPTVHPHSPWQTAGAWSPQFLAAPPTSRRRHRRRCRRPPSPRHRCGRRRRRAGTRRRRRPVRHHGLAGRRSRHAPPPRGARRARPRAGPHAAARARTRGPRQTQLGQ